MLSRLSILILFLCYLPAQAVPAGMDKFKIISADKLDYEDGNSTLIGNVKIAIGDFTLAAPKVLIDSDANGEPSYAHFLDQATLDSEKISIEAQTMDIDVAKSLLKCFAAADGTITTTLFTAKQANLYSEYQEIDLVTGFAKASAKEGAKIKYISEDLSVESINMELELKDLREVKFVNFLEEVSAIGDDMRLESRDLLYFPDQELIKANDDVKLLLLNGEQASYLFADAAIYEEQSQLVTALSRSLEPGAEIHSAGMFGKARQIQAQLINGNQLESAVLTGEAYAQYLDKSVLGHEILFDAGKQELKTLVGRPRTRLLK
ncbi:MAG: hypothetical protein OXU45_08785 [Candidatus Melainabacteria bacterium]|nr:hypothetical protein [Candidatus Melainabacteria bacterium]